MFHYRPGWNQGSNRAIALPKIFKTPWKHQELLAKQPVAIISPHETYEPVAAVFRWFHHY